jgi:hypothetical protein
MTSLLQNEVVELSWVSEEDDKKVEASPYLQILNKLYEVPIIEYANERMDEQTIVSLPVIEGSSQLRLDLNENIPSEVKMDALLCPWRYIFGYVTADHPAYRTKFHYSFAISNLIAALASVTGESKEIVAREVFELFPYLKDVERQQIKDYVSSNVISETYALDGVSYTEARMLVHYLQRKIREDAELCYSKQLEDGNIFALFGERKNGADCKFCPHVSFCSYANSREEESI